ncbi:MAG: hypothetical protein AB7T06_13625 [Kofleriaceae bacterium]
MSELRSVPATVVEPPPAPGPSPSDSSPIPVLAEGTAPVAIRYRPAPRRAWPFVAAGLAVAAAALGGYAMYAKREARRELEVRYPIAATAAQQSRLESGAARWSQGRDRLLATLATFDAPDLATLKGVGACTLDVSRTADEVARAALVSDAEAPSWDDRDLDVSLRHVVLPDESLGDLAALARPEIDQLIDAAERGRFQTVAGRDHILHAVGGAFVVVRVDELRMPELDRANDALAPGVLVGTAYAFDPASGALRCAGTVRAVSSQIGTLSGFSGLDRAREAAIRDFEVRVEASIVSSLRSVD